MTIPWTTNAYETHQPLLETIAQKGNGKMLEFGAGQGSTPMLHDIATAKKGMLETFEGEQDWYSRFAYLQNEHHYISHTTFWGILLDDLVQRNETYDLIFVDQAPWEARADTIRRLKEQTGYILLHDCDYLDRNGLLNFDKDFYSYEVWYPVKPWPYKTGPPTLLASMYHKCNAQEMVEEYYA